MKNKKTLYILIPLVALIWGVVIWKVIDFKPSGQDNELVSLYTAEESVADTSRYELSFGYNDPFLRSSVRSGSAIKSKNKEKTNNIKRVDPSPEATVVRPEGLVYHGEIEGQRRELGLLEMEGKKVLVSERTMVGKYTIVSVQSDSIIISYRDKKFSYGKQ